MLIILANSASGVVPGCPAISLSSNSINEVG
jgi:hypothetical protein